MSMNDLNRAETVTCEDVEFYMARARRIRAEATRDGMIALWAMLKSLPARLGNRRRRPAEV